MALHSRLTTRQYIVVMYQLYVPHSKHPYYSTMCALHSHLNTRQYILVMYQLYVLHRKQPYHSTVCEAQVLGAVYLVLSLGLSSREESRLMDLNTFMMFKGSQHHNIQCSIREARLQFGLFVFFWRLTDWQVAVKESNSPVRLCSEYCLDHTER